MTLMACLLDSVSHDTVQRGIEPHMAGGEAHWLVVIVERHIAVLKEMLTRLTDEEKEYLGPLFLLQYAVEPKNTRGIKDGYSPSQWFLGRRLADEIVGGKSLEGVSSHHFNAHVKRVVDAQKASVGLDSRALVRRALPARNRLVGEFEQAQLVCHYRRKRGRTTALLQRLGPARVVFAGPS